MIGTLGGGARWYGADPAAGAVQFSALVSFGYETWIGYLHTLAFVEAEQGDVTTFAAAVGRVNVRTGRSRPAPSAS